MSLQKVGALVCFAGLAAACAPCEAKEKEKPEGPSYYYVITACDGSAEIAEMTREEAKTRQKAMAEEYKERVKEWEALKKKWTEVSRSSSLPVLKPVRPRFSRESRVPSNERSREHAAKKNQRHLERWDVCLVRSHTGDRSIAVVRHDRVRGRLQELQKAHIEALILWALAHKDDPPKPKDDDKPAKPYIKRLKGPLGSAALAEKHAETYAEKLDKVKEKEAAERERKEAEAEKRKEAEQKKADEKKAGEDQGGVLEDAL